MVNPMSLRFPIGTAHSRRIRPDGKAKCCENWLALIPPSKPIPRLTGTCLASLLRTAPRQRRTTISLSLESARRRAFFEWTEEHIEQIAGEPHALDLARGRHLRLFRNLPLEKDPAGASQALRASVRRHFAS